jgi:glutamate dehydrogenase
MALKTVDLKTELIEAVCARVRERLPAEQAPSCEAFVRQYYHWLPPEDSAARSPLDLYGAAIAHWNLAQRRAPREAKVRVYNPDYEQHGWRCPPHTVVEVVTSDMPYLVDSVTMELTRQGYLIDLVIHPVMQIRRDADGQLLEVTVSEVGATDANGGADAGANAESVLHVEVGREPDHKLLAELRAGLVRVLSDVRAAVGDWEPMRRRSHALIEELESQPPAIAAEEIEEVKAFLRWLVDDHFTFLGYREYDFLSDEDPPGLRAIADSGLGILRGEPVTPDEAQRQGVGAGSGPASTRADRGQLELYRPPAVDSPVSTGQAGPGHRGRRAVAGRPDPRAAARPG